MFAKLNLAGASGLMAGLVLIFGGFVTVIVHVLGLKLLNKEKNLWYFMINHYIGLIIHQWTLLEIIYT